MSDKEKVVILRCDTYKSQKICQAVMRGMNLLGVRPFGRVFVKPNVVFAYHDNSLGGVAYTHPEFVAGVLKALSRQDLLSQIRRVDIGEKAGIGMPTRMIYKWASYYEMAQEAWRHLRFPLRIFPLEETRRKEVFVGGKVHSFLCLSRWLVDSDYFVSLPKLKLHGLAGVSCAIKLLMGILNDDERALRHDYAIHDKFVDTLLAVANKPQLIIVDAVEAGVGMEMGSKSRQLNIVIMGTNAIAIDLVAGYLYGLRPPEEKIGYLKAAIQRGFKPTSLKEVEVIGDYRVADLDLLAERLKPHDNDYYWWVNTQENLRRVNSPIRYYLGPAVKSPKEIHCGSCDMALRLSFGAIEAIYPQSFPLGKPLVIVIGEHDEINAEGADVLMVGKCAQVGRLLNAGRVERINRCFTTVMDLVFDLPDMADLPNPSVESRFLCAFVWNSLISFFKRPQKATLEKLWFASGRFLKMLKRRIAS